MTRSELKAEIRQHLAAGDYTDGWDAYDAHDEATDILAKVLALFEEDDRDTCPSCGRSHWTLHDTRRECVPCGCTWE